RRLRPLHSPLSPYTTLFRSAHAVPSGVAPSVTTTREAHMNIHDPIHGPVPDEDLDPGETAEWLDALAAVVRAGGEARGRFLLRQLEEQAQELGILAHVQPYSSHRNTIPLERQPPYPGDPAI